MVCIGMARPCSDWIGLQNSGMAMPSSLLIGSDSERWICTASLKSRVVLLLVWSSTLVSSHKRMDGVENSDAAMLRYG